MDIGDHRFFSKNQRVIDFWEPFMPMQGYPAKDDILIDRNKTFVLGGDPEKQDCNA